MSSNPQFFRPRVTMDLGKALTVMGLGNWSTLEPGKIKYWLNLLTHWCTSWIFWNTLYMQWEWHGTVIQKRLIPSLVHKNNFWKKNLEIRVLWPNKQVFGLFVFTKGKQTLLAYAKLYKGSPLSLNLAVFRQETKSCLLGTHYI